MFKRLIRLLGFPFVLVSAVVAMWALMRLGVPPAKAATGMIFVEAVLLLVLQRVQPCEPEWRSWKPDAGVDLLHMLLSNGLTIEAVRAVMVGTLIAVAATLAEWWGGTLWPTHAPLPLQVVLALLIGDFVVYWYHRASHRFEPLWRLHALHHSSERLYVLSSARSHPLHVMGTYAFQTVPLVVAGASPEALAYMGLINAVHGLLQHANVDLWHGPFNLVFSTADYHRWHHSTELGEGNTNFGNTFIVWDALFGTRFLPGERERPAAVGLPGDHGFPRDFWGQLVSPLTWRG